jgi:hypothetical protein
MRWLAGGCRAGLFGLTLLVALATTARAAEAVALADAMRRLDAQPLAASWFDADGSATLEQVADPAGAARFTRPAPPDAIQDLGA